MHSRARKIARTDSDFQTLHRQLNSDFEVHLYLTDQQNQNSNTSGYASLLNNLILHRRERSKKLLRLKTTNQYPQFQEESLEYSQFKDMEERTGKEEQIKKTLERQITQIKKSLNLLKGDIGHLVIRNESSQLLGSKVSKAKIVAEDQLKRVTLALAKDREEIKLRNEMQKKFNKKLNNVSNYETNGLTRAKNNYIETQLRQEEAYKKLIFSQKTAQNGEEMALLLTVKEKLDANNLALQQSFFELKAMTDHFSLKQRETPPNVEELNSEIEAFHQNLSLPSESSEQQMEAAVERIIEQYKNIKESIRVMSEFYEEQLKVRDELVCKVREYEHEQDDLQRKFQYQILQSYKINDQQIEQFQNKLKRFTSIIKTYFVLLSYLEKIDTEEQSPRLRSRYSCHQPNITCSYITELHHIHNVLTSPEPLSGTNAVHNLSPEEIHNFYQFMLSDLHQWLHQLKNHIKQQSISKTGRKPYIKCTNYNRVTQILEPIPTQVLEEEGSSTPPYQKLSSHHSQHSEKAKRIQLLEDIDSNYYKMIKSTLKMEKENTRKNYNFLKKFKRAKYASRDQILEEKRFEASFSVLFANHVEASHSHTHSRTLKTTEILSKNNDNSSPFRPFKTTHSSAHTSLRKKDSRQNTAVPEMRKIRSSFFGEREQKTRLTQKLRMALEYC